ncbi:hypothetical protein GCM10022199_07450 [Marihabitans asiaticum]|uniref:Cell division protein FtsB n=1 Tax=Marihabitans asiaticum TaxID=415218 RepID=A0A560WD50_9MICO|nr:septum formation initiator family protein [Marihabitans asiaticum]TWD15599.1 cell division protein FtsB [Marihabitans asiaticum]
MTPQRWIGLCCVVVLLGMMLVPASMSYLEQRSRIAALREDVATQEQAVADLKREKELWATDEYVEAQARERLKFVKVGDKAYTVIDADPGEDDAIDPQTGAATGEPAGPWYERLSASLEAADARPAQP